MAYLARRFMGWFYRPFTSIFTRSRDYALILARMGMPADRLVPLLPGIDTALFHPRHRDPGLPVRLGARPDAVKVLCLGRVSVEKNLPLLVRVWKAARARLRAESADAQLLVVGDGPYRAAMERDRRVIVRITPARAGPDVAG